MSCALCGGGAFAGCCPCDVLVHPREPNIAAGLPALPRQLAGFVEYRQALLRDIPLHDALSSWRARSADDLGIMLFEMWAYVLDVVGFYDERIANETYLRTAVRRPSLRRLVDLIGYFPRPALASSVTVAAIAEGSQSIDVPAGTAFRSDAFGSEPPQIFETEFAHVIHALKNEWQVAPRREAVIAPPLLLETESAGLSRGQIAVFVWPDPATSAAAGRKSADPLVAASQVVSAKAVRALDGEGYVELTLQHAPPFGSGTLLADVQVLSPTLSSAVTGPSPVSHSKAVPTDGGSSRLLLESVFRQIRSKDVVVVERAGELLAFQVREAFETELIVPTRSSPALPVRLPVTELLVSPRLPGGWQASPRSLSVHFGLRAAGKLTRPAKSHLGVEDFSVPGSPLEGTIEPLPPGVSGPAEVLLLDAQGNGVLASGQVQIAAGGEGKVSLTSGTAEFQPPLRTPVTLFGNLLRATRGESVFDEVLGSGDASAFQTFVLGKKPLTYLNDSAAPSGRRSTLEVRVNGVRWQEVPSFFGAGPASDVYIVRQNDEGASVIRFGDGVTGARPPSGADNVTASYRFGAGAAKPPAGAIGQLAKGVAGLRRVVNPVAAGGGADADRPKDIRRNAAASALTLGRAVSVPDFEALAREFGGVINVHTEWAWALKAQSAVVNVCFISDGGPIAEALRAFLVGQADPHTPLVAVQARGQASELVIDLELDPRFNAPRVLDDVRQKLTEPEQGILALQNIPIGRALFRSRIFDAVLEVPGTRSVRALTLDGQPAPFAIAAGPGEYRDFLAGLTLRGSAAAFDAPAR